MKVNRAIVTGGSGFIGGHIVDELIARGIETFVIDDLSSGSLENLQQHNNNQLLHFFVGNAKNIGKVMSEVDNIDVVFHEAAIASVSESVTNPMRVHDMNVNMSLDVMNFCLEKKIKRIVFASSAAVYGILDSKASEDMVCNPYSPYGASKLCVENYLHAYYKTYGLETVALRYFNVYGPRQILNDYSGVITIFINKLLSNQKPIIFGDGNQVRDFISVRDIIKANMLAMESDRAIGKVFNVATGKSISVNQLFKILKEISKVNFEEPMYAPARKGDVKFGLASVKKIEDELGFEAKMPMKEGLAEVVDYIKKKSELQKSPAL